MQISPLIITSIPLLKPKPKLSSQSTNKQWYCQKRIEYFYRYHIVSLIKGCKKNPYDSKNSLLTNNNKRRSSCDQKSNGQSLLLGLFKIAMTKSKYRHRQKNNFNSRCPAILKYLKYTMEQIKKNGGENLYDDLIDIQEIQSYEKQDSNSNIKLFQKDLSFTDQSIKSFKKKHNVSQATKIFITNYNDLREYFLSKGWYENTVHDSLYYDFKFITKSKNIDYINAKDYQIINHYQRSNNLTTKFGLCRNIKNTILIGEDPDEFYPRCYDLYDSLEFEDWIEEFKFSKIVAILKSSLYVAEEERGKNRRLLETCINCAQKYTLGLKQKVALIEANKYPIITKQEWDIISIVNQQKIQQVQQTISLKQKIESVLVNVKRKDIQYNINKQNIWIVKPGGKSRGRGIKAFSDLKQILNYVTGIQDATWVIQKYLQNPLIIKNRKFDIRQWVLVTDLKPLRIWTYTKCYVRFSAEDYSPQNIKNRFAHLTNNSVAKYSQNFNNQQIKQNMYFEEELAQAIMKYNKGIDIFPELKIQMKQIIKKSIISVSQMIQSRKNSLQIFGYDFMIDTDLKPWLIQVNSSPSMQHSTHVTQKLVPQALKGYGQIITDYMLGGKQPKANIGGWELIYNQ